LSLSVKRQFTLQIADLYLFTSKRTIARVHSKNPGNDAEPMQYWKAKKTPDAINPKDINLHFRGCHFAVRTRRQKYSMQTSPIKLEPAAASSAPQHEKSAVFESSA